MSKKNESPTALDKLEYMEMCDICCKSYFVGTMTRVPYVNERGVIFLIRKCPYCDVNAFIENNLK